MKVNKSKMKLFENVYFVKKKHKIWIIPKKLILFLKKKKEKNAKWSF